MIPFRLLFWNMGNTATATMVAKLAKEYEPDIVILAESPHGLAAMVETLNIESGLRYQIPFDIDHRVQIFAKLPSKRIRPIFDGKYLSIKRIQPILGQEFLLATVHLPSKLRLDGEEQASLCARWARDIAEAEAKAMHSRTVVIGDLNMNPFESGLVGSEGFHAISSRAIAAKGSRIILDEERSFFYNPMWSMMGDHSGTPGTFYYASGKPISYFWNTFDQVLLRPAFARNFAPDDVMVLVSAGGESLLNSHGIPNDKISDHLPILATLKLEDVTDGS